MANFDVVAVMSGAFVRASLSGTGGIPRSQSYAEGKAVVTSAKGGSENTYTVSRKFYPSPYDAGISDLVSAFNAVRQHFYERTIPFGFSGAGGRVRASGERLLRADVEVMTEFQSEHERLLARLDVCRESFAARIHSIVSDIECSGACGVDFSRENYPSPDEIRGSYRYDDIQLEAIVDPGSMVLPMSSDIAERVATQMAQRAERQYKLGLQAEATETLRLVQTMAGNLGRLVEHVRQGDAAKGRTPAIYETLFSNVRGAVDKMRAFAMPDTVDGSQLVALADDIEAQLRLTTITADDVKGSVALADDQAQRAARVAKSLEATIDGFFM